VFCPKCGIETPDDSHFCRKCGFALTATDWPTSPAQVPQKRKAVHPAFVLLLILVIGGWIVNNTIRHNQRAIGPKYSQTDALDLVVQEIEEDHIRVTVFGRQNGLRITDMQGRAWGGESTGVPNDAYCPPSSWGVTFMGTAGYSDIFPLAPIPESKGVNLAYCVDKTTGAIKAGNDYAREFTTIPDSTAIVLKPHEPIPVVNVPASCSGPDGYLCGTIVNGRCVPWPAGDKKGLHRDYPCGPLHW